MSWLPWNKWINYEIERAWKERKGLLGVLHPQSTRREAAEILQKSKSLLQRHRGWPSGFPGSSLPTNLLIIGGPVQTVALKKISPHGSLRQSPTGPVGSGFEFHV